MTTGAHFTIRDAVAALLLAAPVLADGRISRKRKRAPMPQTATEEVRVWLHQSDGVRKSLDGKTYDWHTVIGVHCMARGVDSDAAEKMVDTLAQQVTERILTSGRLGGQAIDIAIERITWEGEEMDTSVADQVLAFAIKHRSTLGLTS